MIGAVLYVLLLLGFVIAAFQVREEFERIRRVRHFLSVLGDEEEGS
jgi:hypothetical protein